ncbi:SDR family NAD(P)-dependent oxidoreductase [Alteromonas facilis]|uniref:SDR family NAD(P)-dependent oxidoreductase n=1 Tax=Alteromonas facilis TaxID=2048004 RepID=UPI000C2830F5|nr:SDR family NAD(P)-dependent oxidoreductase [Alteromonas facilis]
MSDSQAKRLLIIGGSSAIAQALISTHVKMNDWCEIAIVSRSPAPQAFSDINQNVAWHTVSEYSEEEIQSLVQQWKSANRRFNRVISTIGLLHDDKKQPEKKLEELNLSSFMHVMQVNAGVNAIWLSHAANIVDRQHCQWVVFSARVGSISDNRLGGWYSYRASKAALNMLMKTASVEFKRRFKNASLVCYHPGTVDSPLSAPFQTNVAPDKLFTPAFTANRLVEILAGLSNDENLHYVDWDGQSITW